MQVVLNILALECFDFLAKSLGATLYNFLHGLFVLVQTFTRALAQAWKPSVQALHVVNAVLDVRSDLDVVVQTLLFETFDNAKFSVKLALLLSHKLECVGLFYIDVETSWALL